MGATVSKWHVDGGCIVGNQEGKTEGAEFCLPLRSLRGPRRQQLQGLLPQPSHLGLLGAQQRHRPSADQPQRWQGNLRRLEAEEKRGAGRWMGLIMQEPFSVYIKIS